MKRRIYKKVSIYICFVLLFCSFPFRFVKASNLQDDSKPIFGLTADDVVEKYNSLSEQQKKQVLRSLGNTSIFANSLFGNIFNSTFGALDDAIEKIGEFFFQANGVIYKLGSSALAWVSRLIDKVFNNNLNDLNISQPVIDDLYINTRGLSFEEKPFFNQYNRNILGLPSSAWNSILPLPADNLVYVCFRTNSYPYSGFGATYHTIEENGFLYTDCLFVDLDSNYIDFGRVKGYLDLDNNYVFDRFIYGINYNYSIGLFDNQTTIWTSYPSFASSGDYYRVNFSGDYIAALSNYLNNYFYVATFYIVKLDGLLYRFSISSDSNFVNLTDNTYYNYIYNIPNQTPLNVNNIVSNTAINYNPVDNIAYYLPDQYNIEQNFSVVNNYYISSGSSITTGSPIDVNLVSPSVIDVRITNPEDISNLVENNTIKQIINNNEFNAGDLNLNTTISTVINSSNDSLSVVSNDSVGLISAFYSCIPSDLMGLYVVEVIVGIAVIWLNVVNHKHK